MSTLLFGDRIYTKLNTLLRCRFIFKRQHLFELRISSVFLITLIGLFINRNSVRAVIRCLIQYRIVYIFSDFKIGHIWIHALIVLPLLFTFLQQDIVCSLIEVSCISLKKYKDWLTYFVCLAIKEDWHEEYMVFSITSTVI